MAIRIPTDQIENLQQIEAVVAGPDGANRLFTVMGLISRQVFASGSERRETFTALVGPVFTRQQFIRAICTASIPRTSFGAHTAPGDYRWGITSNEADWDDESGQVELRIEVSVFSNGTNNFAQIDGLSFQVTILAALAA